MNIPERHITLQIMAIRDALFGFILSFFTINPPATMPKQAPGIAIPPSQELDNKNWSNG